MKKYSKTPNALTLAHLELDRMLLEDLKTFEIIKNTSDFSRLCGKNESYVRCKKSRMQPIHLGSIVFLQSKLAHDVKTEADGKRVLLMQFAMKSIANIVSEKCRLMNMAYKERYEIQ